jgi:rRNA maturation endonuclease Nob1
MSQRPTEDELVRIMEFLHRPVQSTAFAMVTLPNGQTYHYPPNTYSSVKQCPFCGRRQDVATEGLVCKSCGGDVLNEKVQ